MMILYDQISMIQFILHINKDNIMITQIIPMI